MIDARPYCLRFISIASLAFFAFCSTAQLRAQQPEVSSGLTAKAAPHTVLGVVKHAYMASTGVWRSKDCCAVINVSTVAKGEHIGPNTTIFVRYRHEDWVDTPPVDDTEWAGPQGQESGARVLLQLERDDRAGTWVCKPGGFEIPATVPFADADSAKLVVKQYSSPKNLKTTYDLKMSSITTSATVDHSFGDTVGRDTTSGSTSPVVEMLTGEWQTDPDQYLTFSSILTLLDKNGWEITDQTDRLGETISDPITTTLTLNRKNAE